MSSDPIDERRQKAGVKTSTSISAQLSRHREQHRAAVRPHWWLGLASKLTCLAALILWLYLAYKDTSPLSWVAAVVIPVLYGGPFLILICFPRRTYPLL